MRRISSVLLIAALVFAAFPAVGASTYGAGDITKAAVFSLGRCESPAEVDCIESIELKNSAGGFDPLALNSYDPTTQRQDEHGNEITSGRTHWSLGSKQVTLNAELESPEHIILSENGTVTLRGAALRIYIDTDDPLNTYLRIRFRTSWLKPQSVQLKVKDSSFNVLPITGGNLWTLAGSGLQYSDYSSDFAAANKENYSAQAEVENTFFTFFLHHADARSGYGYWPATCANSGFTVQSNNTNATGEPSWNNATKSLEFGIAAPHLTVSGEVNKGYFKLWASTKFLDCKFPKNNLTNAASIQIRVVDETGENQVATTTVEKSNGIIKVYAYGFHFSSPTIILKAKTITLSCAKGKLIKKVSGTNPRCPQGYVKK